MTERDDIQDQARSALAETLGLPEDDVQDSASAAALPMWDSLRHFTLIAALEERFGVIYGSDEIPQMTSLQAITAITEKHVHERGV